MSGRGFHPGTPHRIQGQEHSMGLFYVSSLLEDYTLAIAWRRYVVYHSSWVRGSHRFRGSLSSVLQPRDFHQHVALHQLGGRIQLFVREGHPLGLQPVI